MLDSITTTHSIAIVCEIRRIHDLASDGPIVLDVRIDPDVRLLGSQRVAALEQFAE